MGTAESGRRKIPDRRIEDDGPPKVMAERRVTPERRAVEVMDMDFDEDIDIHGFYGDETDISGRIYSASDW
jgi:hypothetical protein